MGSVRRAAVPDLPGLMRLCAQYCSADGHRFDPDRVRRGLAPLLDSDRHGVVWVVESAAGSITGYVVVTWGWSIESGGADALLDELYAERRNQGLGGLLLDKVIADCRHRGCSRLFLETEGPNAAARRFYGRHGFVVEDSIWMSLELPPLVDLTQ